MVVFGITPAKRPVMKRALLGICLLAATACLNNSPVAPETPLQVVLGPGDQAEVPGAGTRIRFEGVTGDSRCPGDAICITGGDAIVRVTVTPARGSSVNYELHTGDMKPVTHGVLTIALVELAPYPFSSLGPIDPKAYRATLRVSR